jgi:hypothetical protein
VVSKKHKHISIKEFCDLGFLQEVNRLVLHPAGLALEVTFDDDDPDNPWISGVWDYRDDPEGIWFDWKSWPEERSYDKASSVTAEVNKHREARTKMFAEAYPEYVSSDPTIEPVLAPDDKPDSTDPS